MLASLAISVMMVGGWIAPQPDMTIIPLKDDFSSQSYIQSVDRQAEFKRIAGPEVGIDHSYPPPPIEPGTPPAPPPPPKNAPRRPLVMPLPPTQAGEPQVQRAASWGLPPSSSIGLPAGGGNKPFSGQTVTSSPGFSPWMLLNTRTANGTISPYFAFVQPALQQQEFNQRISLQLQSMPPPIQNPGGNSSPGFETPGGSGMADPQIFNNYHGYYPQNP